MKTIWKYEIRPNSIGEGVFPIIVSVPAGAKPLCVMTQHGVPCLWVEVDTDEKRKEELRLLCFGTGHGAVPPGVVYFGSVIEGPYVWHLYTEARP